MILALQEGKSSHLLWIDSFKVSFSKDLSPHQPLNQNK
uniref:Uncharacterized protein n=1 Tax=Rhizophora mucronata TaxID=61149 RepID=A0A2P2ITD3_RHIMU